MLTFCNMLVFNCDGLLTSNPGALIGGPLFGYNPRQRLEHVRFHPTYLEAAS
jgi:hypothetical protein